MKTEVSHTFFLCLKFFNLKSNINNNNNGKKLISRAVNSNCQ